MVDPDIGVMDSNCGVVDSAAASWISVSGGAHIGVLGLAWSRPLGGAPMFQTPHGHSAAVVLSLGARAAEVRRGVWDWAGAW